MLSLLFSAYSHGSLFAFYSAISSLASTKEVFKAPMFADWHLKISNELSFADIEFNGFTLHANTTFELDS